MHLSLLLFLVYLQSDTSWSDYLKSGAMSSLAGNISSSSDNKLQVASSFNLPSDILAFIERH